MLRVCDKMSAIPLPDNNKKRVQPINPPEYRLVVFDPGGTIGWATFTVDCRAFVKPEAKVLRWLKEWNCGEFSGTENSQLSEASALLYRSRYGLPPNQYVRSMDAVSEDFDLVQTRGGKNLLSPVRINAVIDWELQRLCGLKLFLQKRTMRTGVTPERLRRYGFEGRWSTTRKGKDAFAAMQHGIVWLRRVKARSLQRPWVIKPGQMPIHGDVM